MASENEKLQHWAEHFASLMKQTPEGDFVPDESKLDEQAGRLLIELAPDPASISFTIHERVAQYGAFGLYRMTTTIGGDTTEGQEYSVFLGEVSSPQTVSSISEFGTRSTLTVFLAIRRRART